ncbi:MAG: DUF4390 domain-containing protein [Thermodesulfobacteriota bacterium]
MNRQLSILLLLLMVTCPLSSPAADEKKITAENPEPHFSDMGLITSHDDLLFFTRVVNGVTEKMLQGLHNGVPIEFSYTIELQETDNTSEDKRSVDYEFSHTLRYNTLKENYRIEYSNKNPDTRPVADLDEGISALSEINGYRLLDRSKFLETATYKLRVKAELGKKSLPMNLHSVIPFFGWKTKETEWQSLTFSRNP